MFISWVLVIAMGVGSREVPETDSLRCRMVLTAVFCLMVGHPGFVFKSKGKLGASGDSQRELQEYTK
jgi:hypothetical protein